MMLYPTLDEIRQLRDREMAVKADTRKPLLPICCDILADMETPVSAYCKIASGVYSFLLESVVGGEHIARYSFIGIDPYLVMKQKGNTATLHRPASN
ncbi:MAG TPA: anthranilate synthase component I, partial [Ktedonobacteraceae bacterium]|nr:anthranilate synthase component I [Ktedonobacteraceae bacterium]